MWIKHKKLNYTVELKTVGDVAFKKMQELLPNITKEQFKEAYLKRGEFKIESERELKNLSQLEQRKFNRLTQLENKLGELKKKKDLLKEGSNSLKDNLDDDIIAAQDAISKALIEMGAKISNSSAKYKETLENRATAHNENISEVLKEIESFKKDKTEKVSQLLDDLKSKVELSKIDYQSESTLSQSKKLSNALGAIDLAENQLKSIKKQIDKDTYYYLENSLQKFNER